MRAKAWLFFGVAVWIITVMFAAAPRADDRRDGDRRDDDEARIAKGFEIAPVHLNLRGKNRALVGLGSYLVNAVGGCVDCHTNPTFAHGGDPFMGQPKQVNTTHYLAGGAQFGPFTSRNITPGNGLPETFSEFFGIIRTGIDPDHLHPQFGPFLQVMPWPVYQSMNKGDIRAIYEYLRSIPPALPCTTVGPTAPDPTCRP